MKVSKHWLVNCLQSGDENLLERREEALAEDRNQVVRKYLLQPDSASDDSDFDVEEASETAADNPTAEVPLSDSDSEAEDTPKPSPPSDKKHPIIPHLRRQPVSAKERLLQQLQQEVLESNFSFECISSMWYYVGA